MGCPYKALALHNRRKILKYLSKGEDTAGNIGSIFKLSQPTVSNHLKILKEANIISSRQVKQSIFYSTNNQKIDSMILFLDSVKTEKSK